jgi:hypothetical protein
MISARPIGIRPINNLEFQKGDKVVFGRPGVFAALERGHQLGLTA